MARKSPILSVCMHRFLTVVLISASPIILGCESELDKDGPAVVRQKADSVADKPMTVTLRSETMHSDTGNVATGRDPVAGDSHVKALGCECRDWLEEASTQIPVEYADDQAVLLCAHFADGPRDSLSAYDFGVFDCEGSMIFESEGATEYVVHADEPPLKIIERQKVPGESGLFQWQSVAEHVVRPVGNRFRTTVSMSYDPPLMPARRVDSLKQVVNQLARNAESVEAYDDFNPEALVVELFWCSIDGDSECREMFDEVEERGWTDAASGEAWSTFHRLLELRNKDSEG